MVGAAVVVLLLQGMEITRALDAGDLRTAWDMMEQASDPVARARARTEILYLAGDPAGALEAARAGLRLVPGDLDLLHRATGAALWLPDAEAAREFLEQLRRSVAVANLDPQHRPQWDSSVARFLLEAQALDRREAARATAVWRARAVVLSGLGGTVLFLVGSVLRLLRACPRDRSRR